jgi:hypothetical protein
MSGGRRAVPKFQITRNIRAHALCGLLAALLLSALPLGDAIGAEIFVGPTATFTRIQDGINAAAAGDTVTIDGGVYPEIVVAAKNGLTLRAKSSAARPVIVGRINVASAANVTIDGLEITGWTGTYHGIDQVGGTGLTVRNTVIHDGSDWSSSAGISSYTSTRLTIEGNTIFRVKKGLRLIAARSTDATYANGVIVKNNHIHDCPIDGIDIHGEYFTIDGNTIENNMDVNWATTHPDGIQFISATAGGYAMASKVVIKNNLIRNHTQNIFIQGVGIQDVHVFNNIVYNDSTIVNGVDMSTLATKNLVSSPVNGLYVFNNLFGHATNLSVSLWGTGVVYYQNNIHIGGGRGVPFYVANPSTLAAFSHNFFQVSDGYVIVWGDKWFYSLAVFQSAFPDAGSNLLAGNAQVGPFPAAMPSVTSPLVDSGVALGAKYAADRLGKARPGGASWDIGPYEGGGGLAAPTSLTVK